MTSSTPSQGPMKGGLSEMIAIALPMIVSYGCDTVMTFTDRMFLAKLGPEMMNAAMIGGLSAFVSMTFVMGLVGYSTAIIAQYFGAGQKSRCSIALTQALLVALVGYPLILCTRPFVHAFFNAMGFPEAQLIPQNEYFDILQWATILGLIRTCFSSFFSGIGRTCVVMAAALLTMSVNVGANYILIYGNFGFPALGIKGAAYGTIVGSACGVLLLLTVYFRKTNWIEFDLAQSFVLNWPVMRLLLRYGSPSGIEMFLNLVAFDLMISLFHAAGPLAATAATIMFNWDMVSFVPLIGIEVAVISLVGRYMGAGSPETAHQAAMSGLKVGLTYSAIILIFFVGFPAYLVDVFRPVGDMDLFAQARPTAIFMVRVAAFYVLVEAMLVVFTGALRGAGDSWWAMWFSVSMHWILVAQIYIVLHLLKLSPEICWVILVIVFMALCAFVYRRFHAGRWKALRMIEQAVPSAILPNNFHEPRDL